MKNLFEFALLSFSVVVAAASADVLNQLSLWEVLGAMGQNRRSGCVS